MLMPDPDSRQTVGEAHVEVTDVSKTFPHG